MVLDDEVATLDELDAHLPREERVLEVGGVVDARREDHRGRSVASGRRRDGAQRAEQHRSVVVDRTHALRGERDREDAGHGGAVLEHVRDARRVAEVVLEHAVGAIGVAHDVHARDQAARSVRDRDAERLATEALGGVHEPARDDAVTDRRLLTDVEVLEEPVERGDALHDAALDDVPLVGGDHARQQVHREGPLETLLVVGEREGDALRAEDAVADELATLELLRREAGQPLDDSGVVRADRAVRGEDLVEEGGPVVGVEERPHGEHASRRCQPDARRARCDGATGGPGPRRAAGPRRDRRGSALVPHG